MTERIFVTGAAGFIGSNLVDSLLKNGCTVMGIDNFDPFYDRAIKEDNLKNALQHPEFHFLEGDVRNVELVSKSFSDFKPSVVVHLAAKAGVQPSLVNPQAYFDVNLMGTLNLLEVMRKNNIKRLIFASSSSVYGNSLKVPFSEKDNVDFPISPYAASKKAGEQLCFTYHHLYNFDIFCLRFFTVYGPRQRPDLAICKFSKAILKDEPIFLYGDGTSSRDYTHISDIIQGIKSAIKKVKGYDIFNLGESSRISLRDLVSIIEKYTLKKARIEYLPMKDGDVNQTFADIRKAQKKLSYKPEVDINTGIKNYLAGLNKEIDTNGLSSW
jgi:UDP-glucuronate 4-epimerase